MSILIKMQQVNKVYQLGDVAVPVLRNIDLTIHAGDYVAIMGASGSGKSTLLNLLGCLDRPTSGGYTLAEVDLDSMSDDGLAYIRNRQIGFVFQQFNLLPRLTALENVMLPMIYAGIPKIQRQQRATQLLRSVGLANHRHHRPNQLSGGQQQRVAIARALVNQPRLVLADEPTGALDTQTSQEIIDLLSKLNQHGITIVIVTHEPEVAKQTRRIIYVQDGLILNQPAAC
jgi:putative ABC transport system ATP-binding protein